jgi:hypothetical protein
MFHAVKPISYKEAMGLLSGGESPSSEETMTMFTVCLKASNLHPFILFIL